MSPLLRGMVTGALVWSAAMIVATAQSTSPITPAAAKALKNPAPGDAASVQKGAGLFTRYCISCHGPEAKGNGPRAPEGSHPANLTDAQWDHGASDGEIFATIHDGVPPKYDMDAWEGRIPDADIWSLVNFLRSIGAKP